MPLRLLPKTSKWRPNKELQMSERLQGNSKRLRIMMPRFKRCVSNMQKLRNKLIAKPSKQPKLLSKLLTQQTIDLAAVGVVSSLAQY